MHSFSLSAIWRRCFVGDFGEGGCLEFREESLIGDKASLARFIGTTWALPSSDMDSFRRLKLSLYMWNEDEEAVAAAGDAEGGFGFAEGKELDLLTWVPRNCCFLCDCRLFWNQI